MPRKRKQVVTQSNKEYKSIRDVLRSVPFLYWKHAKSMQITIVLRKHLPERRLSRGNEGGQGAGGLYCRSPRCAPRNENRHGGADRGISTAKNKSSTEKSSMLPFVPYVPIVRESIFIRKQEVCHVHRFDTLVVAPGEIVRQENVLEKWRVA